MLLSYSLEQRSKSHAKSSHMSSEGMLVIFSYLADILQFIFLSSSGSFVCHILQGSVEKEGKKSPIFILVTRMSSIDYLRFIMCNKLIKDGKFQKDTTVKRLTVFHLANLFAQTEKN